MNWEARCTMSAKKGKYGPSLLSHRENFAYKLKTVKTLQQNVRMISVNICN